LHAYTANFIEIELPIAERWQ